MLGMTGCQQDAAITPDDGERYVAINLPETRGTWANLDTRATDDGTALAWAEGDRVTLMFSLYIGDAYQGYSSMATTRTADGKWSPEPGLRFGDDVTKIIAEGTFYNGYTPGADVNMLTVCKFESRTTLNDLEAAFDLSDFSPTMSKLTFNNVPDGGKVYIKGGRWMYLSLSPSNGFVNMLQATSSPLELPMTGANTTTVYVGFTTNVTPLYFAVAADEDAAEALTDWHELDVADISANDFPKYAFTVNFPGASGGDPLLDF